MKTTLLLRILVCAGVTTSIAHAQTVQDLISKQQFAEIFPLSDAAYLKKEYTQFYNDFQKANTKRTQADQKCAYLLPPNVWWTQAYQDCINKEVPEFIEAQTKLAEIRGLLGNCPTVSVTDSHGKTINFNGTAPDPTSIHSITTLYTYENFAHTVPEFSGFLSGDNNTAKRELAAFLANISQETSKLCFASETPFDILVKLHNEHDFQNIDNARLTNWLSEEDKKKLGISEVDAANRQTVIQYVLTVKKKKGKYCQWAANPHAEQECWHSNRYYYGRGAIQLSYPYNYIDFGKSPFVQHLHYDLYLHPELVASVEANKDTSLLWGSAIWFWMTPTSTKPSAHDVMTNQWTPKQRDINAKRQPGFGTVINIINGGLECAPGRTPATSVKAQHRIAYYNQILRFLNQPQDDNTKYPLDCDNSLNFDH